MRKRGRRLWQQVKTRAPAASSRDAQKCSRIHVKRFALRKRQRRRMKVPHSRDQPIHTQLSVPLSQGCLARALQPAQHLDPGGVGFFLARRR